MKSVGEHEQFIRCHSLKCLDACCCALHGLCISLSLSFLLSVSVLLSLSLSFSLPLSFLFSLSLFSLSFPFSFSRRRRRKVTERRKDRERERGRARANTRAAWRFCKVLGFKPHATIQKALAAKLSELEHPILSAEQSKSLLQAAADFGRLRVFSWGFTV